MNDEERAAELIHDVPLAGNDRQGAAYVRAELIDKIAAAIAAEREACAVAAGIAVMRVKTGTQAARNMTLAEFRSVCSCAAEDAIKARGVK